MVMVVCMASSMEKFRQLRMNLFARPLTLCEFVLLVFWCVCTTALLWQSKNNF